MAGSTTASAFNRLGQYVSSPGNRAYCYAELAVSSLAMAVTLRSQLEALRAQTSAKGWVLFLAI